MQLALFTEVTGMQLPFFTGVTDMLPGIRDSLVL